MIVAHHYIYLKKDYCELLSVNAYLYLNCFTLLVFIPRGGTENDIIIALKSILAYHYLQLFRNREHFKVYSTNKLNIPSNMPTQVFPTWPTKLNTIKLVNTSLTLKLTGIVCFNDLPGKRHKRIKKGQKNDQQVHTSILLP